ncbi:CHAP domain-containing protein [Microterricola viridarii]|nr:CHAP domain-containing protein [Microterricola viridarii]
MTEPASSRLNGEPSTDAALPSRRAMREQWAIEAAAESASASAPSGAEPVLVESVDAAPEVAAPVVPRADPKLSRAVRDSVQRAAAASAPLRRALSAPRRPQQARRGAMRSLVTFAVVPGLFLTAALPAYALGADGGLGFGASSAREASTAGAQSVKITSFSPEVSVTSDGFTAVSAEEIQRLTAEAERQAAELAAAEAASARVRAGANTTPGVRQEGDDYPWPWEATDDQGGGLSPMNYYYRECVDFVAWRLNRDAGATGPFKWVWSTLTPSGGNAYNWANAWNSNGWTTSYEPITGAVAWFTANHVAYVQSVPGDGTVVLEEYNWGNDHSYHRRTVPIGEVDLFLYPPP